MIRRGHGLPREEGRDQSCRAGVAAPLRVAPHNGQN